MAPVSTFLHWLGIRIRQYLDDWLVQAQSRELVLQALEEVLSLCPDQGIVINPAKSNLVPSQRVLYLGTVFDSLTFRASPSQQRTEELLLLGEEFLSSRRQPESSRRVLLEHSPPCSILFRVVVSGCGPSSRLSTVPGIRWTTMS